MITVPFSDEATRVHISPVRGVEGSDYINASFIDVSKLDIKLVVSRPCVHEIECL